MPSTRHYVLGRNCSSRRKPLRYSPLRVTSRVTGARCVRALRPTAPPRAAGRAMPSTSEAHRLRSRPSGSARAPLTAREGRRRPDRAPSADAILGMGTSELGDDMEATAAILVASAATFLVSALGTAWRLRRSRGSRSVRLMIGNDMIELNNMSAKDAERIIETFVARRTADAPSPDEPRRDAEP